MLGDLKSPVAIATLWTPKEKVAEFLAKKDYAAVGQLYTKRGISILIRNLLANPNIKRLIVCGTDQSGSGEALVSLWGDLKADRSFLDEEITPKALSQLISSVELVNLIGSVRPQKIKEAINALLPKLPQREEGIILPEPKKVSSSLLPAEIDLVKFRRKKIGQAWLAAIKHLLGFGLESEAIHHYFTKGENKIYEALNLALVVEEEDPDNFEIFDFFPFKKEEVENYIKEVFKKDRGEEPYTYGERLFDYEGVNQIAQMAQKLSRFKQDHGALAVLWNPKIDNFPIRKPWRTPCLSLLQGQVYQNKLYLTAYFRSNDMFGAWPLNAFALRYLQGRLAEKVDVGLGALITISNMATLYDHDFVAAAEIVKSSQDELCQWDPRGNLIIKVEDKKILVDQVSPKGEPLRSFSFDGSKKNAATKIGLALEGEGCFSTLGHACYVGQELAKAEAAIKQGLQYEQDKELK